MAVDAPAGILDPKQPWYNAQVGPKTWIKLKAQLTGKKQSDGSQYISGVNLSDSDADRLIENMKKEPRGFPMFNNNGGDSEKYQKWLVETYLGNASKPEKEPELPDLPKSSAIVPTTKKEEDLVDEEIDERILNILGLKDVFDIDYGTYKTLLREKLAESSVGKSSVPREEEMLIQEEFKRVKKKAGRFKPKPKKTINADAFFGKETAGAESSFKPKALLPPSKLDEPKLDEPKEEKKNDILDFLKGDFLKELQSIREVVENIAENLKKQYELEDKARESSRRESELGRGRAKEKQLETKEDKAPTLLQKITKPFTSLFDTIKNFLLNVLLGTAVVWILDLIKNPQKLLQPIQGVLNGIFGFFNSIIQWIDKTVVDPIRGFISNVNSTIQSFINQVNNALKLIPGGGQIQAPQLPNIPNAPTINAPNITGRPIQKAAGGGVIRRFSGGGSNPANNLQVSSSNGYVTKDTGVEISGMGADTQLTALRQGEFVLVPGAAGELGVGFLKGLNKKYGGTNQPQIASAGSAKISGMSGGGLVGDKSPKISNADYNSLLAVSSIEDITPQGRADVAQSIYNRVLAGQKYNVNFYQKKNTIKDHILAEGQYQPIFGNIKDWSNITDRKTAAIAVMNSDKGRMYKWKMNDAMKLLDDTEKAIKNPALQKSAQKFVGGRSFFLSSSQRGNMKSGDVIRDSKSNFFSPWSLEGSKFDKERRNVAAPIPAMIKSKPTPPIPGNRKKKSPTIIPLPFGNPPTKLTGNSSGAKSTPKTSFSSVDSRNITSIITSAILGLIN
jgi:hypothetical protein